MSMNDSNCVECDMHLCIRCVMCNHHCMCVCMPEIEILSS